MSVAFLFWCVEGILIEFFCIQLTEHSTCGDIEVNEIGMQENVKLKLFIFKIVVLDV